MFSRLIILKHSGSDGNDITSSPCNTIKVQETVLLTHQSLAALPFTQTHSSLLMKSLSLICCHYHVVHSHTVISSDSPILVKISNPFHILSST